jgi:acetyl esterase/lipase
MPVRATGNIRGHIFDAAAQPIAGATALVATRDGRPFAGVTDARGSYTITAVPVGQYAVAAVAPGFEETVAQDRLGLPDLVTVRADSTTFAPDLQLAEHHPVPLPAPLPAAVELRQTATYTASAPYPPGAVAQVRAFRFVRDGEIVDTLRLYLPLHPPTDAKLPLLFMIYPSPVDDWETVSVALAAAGYAFLAISPVAARGVHIDGHAQDARLALTLARAGHLAPDLAPGIYPDNVVVIGGSFSSPIVHRLLRDERDAIAAWITVGGISNGFTIAADFYAGRLEMPPQYTDAIPALGAPNLYPLLMLRYSPIFTAAQLPPTLIIHTDVDRVTPIDQAYALEAALQAAGVPVDTFYYADVSHYLQIGDDLTEAGKAMYELILDFARQHQTP